jgi:hypothetical protein
VVTPIPYVAHPTLVVVRVRVMDQMFTTELLIRLQYQTGDQVAEDLDTSAKVVTVLLVSLSFAQ